MDVVRLYLAMSVMIAHFNRLTGYDMMWPTSSYEAVGGFFALSGFLIYRTYYGSSDIYDFLYRRAIRILPAYFTTVIFFALILCFFSYLTIDHYFRAAGFWEYLVSNIAFLNFLKPDLPGVFDDDTFLISAVNGSLWTMKVEWFLYLSVIPVVWLHKRMTGHLLSLMTAIISLSAVYRYCLVCQYQNTGNELFEILSRQFIGQLIYFYIGVGIYFYKDIFVRKKCWILCIIVLIALTGSYFDVAYDYLLRPLIVSVAVIWISIVGDCGSRFKICGDISYNLYLMHWPVIQIGVALGMRGWPVAAGIAFTVLMTTSASLMSLNYVERPIRKYLNRRFLRTA